MGYPPRGDYDNWSRVCQVFGGVSISWKLKQKGVVLQRPPACSSPQLCQGLLDASIQACQYHLSVWHGAVHACICLPVVKVPWSAGKNVWICLELAVTAVEGCSTWSGCSPHWRLVSPWYQEQSFGYARWGRAHRNTATKWSLVFLTLSASSTTSHSSQPSKCRFTLLSKQCLILLFNIRFIFLFF